MFNNRPPTYTPTTAFVDLRGNYAQPYYPPLDQAVKYMPPPIYTPGGQDMSGPINHRNVSNTYNQPTISQRTFSYRDSERTLVNPDKPMVETISDVIGDVRQENRKLETPGRTEEPPISPVNFNITDNTASGNREIPRPKKQLQEQKHETAFLRPSTAPSRKNEETYETEYFDEYYANYFSRPVFDRLTHAGYFSGQHRFRFDPKTGKGRGKAGREDLYYFDGLTESISRRHEVYQSGKDSSFIDAGVFDSLSSAGLVKVNPSVLPDSDLTDFSLRDKSVNYEPIRRKENRIDHSLNPTRRDLTRPALMIIVFRNGDIYDKGTVYYLKSHIRNLSMLYKELTKATRPIGGVIRELYDSKLQKIRKLKDIVDCGSYLACEGCGPSRDQGRIQHFLKHCQY